MSSMLEGKVRIEILSDSKCRLDVYTLILNCNTVKGGREMEIDIMMNILLPMCDDFKLACILILCH